jgi:hypothetical protein
MAFRNPLDVFVRGCRSPRLSNILLMYDVPLWRIVCSPPLWGGVRGEVKVGEMKFSVQSQKVSHIYKISKVSHPCKRRF